MRNLEYRDTRETGIVTDWSTSETSAAADEVLYKAEIVSERVTAMTEIVSTDSC